jgi:hypothetical protein
LNGSSGDPFSDDGKVVRFVETKEGVCFGAFVMLRQFLNVVNSEDGTMIFKFCLPQPVSAEEMIRLYVHEIDKKPDIGHEDFFLQAMNIFQARFGCPANYRSPYWNPNSKM